MDYSEKNELIDDLCKSLFGEKEHSLFTLGRYGGKYLDASRPNIHDNKQEFLLELEAVETVLKNCESTFSVLWYKGEEGSVAQSEMIDRLSKAIDQYAHNNFSKRDLETSSDLALKNVVDSGFHLNTLLLTVLMIGAYRNRRSELKDQEAEFWSVSYRPPNYYARTIALRFARLFARERGVRPTTGTAREGNHPSTDYGRALEEIFAILEIKADVGKASKWAVKQLTEDDLVQPKSEPMGGLFGFGIGRETTDPTISPVAEALAKFTK